MARSFSSLLGVVIRPLKQAYVSGKCCLMSWMVLFQVNCLRASWVTQVDKECWPIAYFVASFLDWSCFNQPINTWINKSINRSIDRSVNQSIVQSINLMYKSLLGWRNVSIVTALRSIYFIGIYPDILSSRKQTGDLKNNGSFSFSWDTWWNRASCILCL